MSDRRSECRRAFEEDGAHKTHIGGQALIEGVMMRGKTHWAVAVRAANGSLYEEDHPLNVRARTTWMGLPLVRGCVAFVDSLLLGFKALEISALHADLDDDDALVSADGPIEPSLHDANNFDDACSRECCRDASKEEMATEFEDDSSGLSRTEIALSFGVGVVIALALFMLVPAALSNLVVGDYNVNPFAWNMIDGFARVAIFVFYVWLISRMEDIKRMFAYHGAEHKTIHCFEHGLDLTVENARQFPRLHVRCGTAFMIMVMIIALLLYTVVPIDQLIAALGVTNSIAIFVLVLVVRIALLPLIAGISYEITVRWAGSHPDNPFVRVFLWPGMQMQRLTTNEPDDGQLECAIAAMKRVLAYEQETK